MKVQVPLNGRYSSNQNYRASQSEKYVNLLHIAARTSNSQPSN